MLLDNQLFNYVIVIYLTNVLFNKKNDALFKNLDDVNYKL